MRPQWNGGTTTNVMDADPSAVPGSVRNHGSQREFYRPELDVLRCVAFLLVFLHHSLLFPSGRFADIRIAGGFGVCLFFFLSAFLITELLDREKQITGTIRLGAFYVRRTLRIWPLYFAVLLLDFGYMHIWKPGVFTTEHLASFALLAGNWFVAHHGWIGALSVPLWSISIEEQFYLLWPSVRLFLGRNGAILVALLTLCASYIIVVVLCRQGINLEISLWVNSFLQIQFFATGALLALLLKHRCPALHVWQRLSLFSTGLLGFYLAQSVFRAKAGLPLAQARLVVPGFLLVNAGCILIFLSFLGMSELSRAKPLIQLGKISYGLYVFHWGALIFWRDILKVVQQRTPAIGALVPALQAILSLATTALLATLSYRYFEKPILRFKQRFEAVRTRPI